MRARTLLLLFLAILLAGGTVLLARSYLATQQTRLATEQQAIPLAATPSKDVLVARGEIKRGQILRPEDTTWQIWPEGALDKNYIVRGGPPLPARTPESFTGWVARNPIEQGEPITDSRVIAPGNRGFLAAVLRPGMRAISVPVTITSGISGFIFPGDQVDLLLTYTYKVQTIPKPQAPGEAKEEEKTYELKVAETLLRDIRVIAIDQRLESKPGEAVPAHTATFEVTPKQSEAIALADELGKLSLSLRSLTPSPREAPAVDQAAARTEDQITPDSPVAAAATYTDEDQIASPLPGITTPLRQYLARRTGRGGPEVTILRGGVKTSESGPESTPAGGS
jgi:pilus assembly protein CpaB